MKTERNKSEFIKELTASFQEVIGKHQSKSRGCILVAYDKDEKDSMQNAFNGAGTPVDLAECLYACMKQDQTLANVVVTAATAFMSTRAAEEAGKMAGTTKPMN